MAHPLSLAVRVAVALLLAAVAAVAQPQPRASTPPVPARSADYHGDFIVAVVNSDLVTAAELDQRVAMMRAAGAQRGTRPPATEQLRREALDALINERVISTYARETGIKVDDAELQRAVQSVAASNQLSVAQLQQRLAAEGIDYARFRANLRDQIVAERVREREVGQRIRVQDAEIDEFLAKRNATAARERELNVAQILVTVPDGASSDEVARQRERAEQALARVQRGEDFALVAREMSDDAATRASGGVLGMRAASRLPDAFVAQVGGLQPGQVSPTLLRSGAGFHVLKLVDRQDVSSMRVAQTLVRHILLRPSAQVSLEMAEHQAAALRAQIERGASFEALAREYSQDASAAQGGDLGWVMPGTLVPEFEEAMNRLPIGGVSAPVVSRFGVHLIQVVDRREVTLDAKQVREQARNALRERKFEQAYLEWIRELRARAYIELRDPP